MNLITSTNVEKELLFHIQQAKKEGKNEISYRDSNGKIVTIKITDRPQNKFFYYGGW